MGIFKPNIEKLQDRKNIKSLFEALKYKDSNTVRSFAAKALGEMGGPAVEPLIEALKSEVCYVRQQGVAKALGEIGDGRAVDPLIRALEDENWLVPLEASVALKKIKAKIS